MSSVQAGIGSIIGFECEKQLRRTLSAVDMSSKIWLSSNQSGFSPLEKIASSSDELQNIAVEHKNDCSQQQQQQPGQFDIWCSIQIQKPSSLPPPYVHPLVKKSKSCLSLKSLEICTENIGSESGSSNISLSDTDEEHEEEEEAIQVVVDEPKVVKVDVKQGVVMNNSKKSPKSVIPRSFPPPLNSLSRPGGGIQMKTHRMNGRLVLESVSVTSSQNCFNAQRQDGRLVLTFASPIPESKSFDNVEDVFETHEEVEFGCSHRDEIEQEDEEEDKGIVLEMTSTRVLPELQPTGVMNVHRSALMVNRFIGLENKRNDLTTWPLSSKYNQLSINLVLPESLPISSPALAAGQGPQQTVAAVAAVEASSFNRYEYCWRNETSSMATDVGGIYHSLNQQSLPNTKNTYYSNNSNNLLTSSNNNFSVKDSITTTKRGIDYMEEKQNGEKVLEHLIVAAYSKQEPRRSLVFCVPYSVATS